MALRGLCSSVNSASHLDFGARAQPRTRTGRPRFQQGPRSANESRERAHGSEDPLFCVGVDLGRYHSKDLSVDVVVVSAGLRSGAIGAMRQGSNRHGQTIYALARAILLVDGKRDDVVSRTQ